MNYNSKDFFFAVDVLLDGSGASIDQRIHSFKMGGIR